MTEPTASQSIAALEDITVRSVEQLVETRARLAEVEADRDQLAATIDRMKRTNRMVNGGARESRLRAEASEAALARIGQMVDAWERQLPETIRTATAVDAIRTALDTHLRPAVTGKACCGSAVGHFPGCPTRTAQDSQTDPDAEQPTACPTCGGDGIHQIGCDATTSPGQHTVTT